MWKICHFHNGYLWYTEETKRRNFMNYTYIVKCADGSFYTGWTTDIERRLKCHNAGKGAKYTRPRLPVELVYFESFETKEEAMRREAAIKKLSRERKEQLVAQWQEI
jgi:putative endonuclease